MFDCESLYELEVAWASQTLIAVLQIVELIKEQICHQQMANTRMEEGRDRDVDEEIDIFDEDRRHGSFHSSQSWVTERSHVSTPQPVRRFQSSSTSNLPTDVDISLEQVGHITASQVNFTRASYSERKD